VEKFIDPLKWWMNNQVLYPNLHRMTLDYLSVPSASTVVERVLSQGRHLLHFTRNRLSLLLSRTVLCLGSWLRCDLVVHDELVDVVKALQKKRLRDGDQVDSN
ncbi:hypothetical protein PAXRUDRAFT_153548, partial [Paxillus rubicundulus Ve08.2h10]